MATTAQQIIDRAVQRSALNNADLVPTAQLLSYISRYESQAFLRAARVNPDYFGKDSTTATRAVFTDSWDIGATPGDIAALTKAEVATIVGSVAGVSVGTKVNLIGLRWPEIDVPPRAYVRGRRITGFGTELGAATPNMVTVLKLFYSQLPATILSATQSLTLPDEWTLMLELPLARILTVRDRRLDEVASIDEEYNFIRGMFDEAVLTFDHGIRRPLAAVPAIPIGSSRGQQ